MKAQPFIQISSRARLESASCCLVQLETNRITIYTTQIDGICRSSYCKWVYDYLLELRNYWAAKITFTYNLCLGFKI